MGLASSQARLLNLTSRMHQIEYKAAKLEAEKLQMANASRRAYLEYQEATEKTKIQIKSLLTNAASTYIDIENYEQMNAAGFAFCVHGVPVDEDGNIVSNPSQAKGEKDIVCEGTTALQNALGAKYHKTITLPTNATEFRAALSNIVTLGDVTIVQEKVENGVNKGFPDPTAADFADWESNIATNTSFQEVEDTAGLRKAEAKYEADMRRIDMKDRKFDYDLQALEAERNAIKQEMETLKTVAKDNVERTFKLFS